MTDPKKNGNGNGNGNNKEVEFEVVYETTEVDPGIYIKTDKEGNQSLAYSEDVTEAISGDDEPDDNGNGRNGKSNGS